MSLSLLEAISIAHYERRLVSTDNSLEIGVLLKKYHLDNYRFRVSFSRVSRSKGVFRMHEEQASIRFSLPAKMRRRTFLKAGASLGLSAAALEAWLAGSGTALAEVPGLTAYWPLNEGSGTSTLDVSGNSNNGQINGATWTTG